MIDDASVDVGDVGVAGIGGDMVGIVMGSVDAGADVESVIMDAFGYMRDSVAAEVEEDGIGGKGDTERELGSGIRVGSAGVAIVVEMVDAIEVRELQDERELRDGEEIG